MTDIANLALGVDSKGVKTGTLDLKKLAEESGKTERKVSGATDKMNKGFGSMTGVVKGLVGALAAVGAVRLFTGALQESMRMEKQLNIVNQLVSQTGAAAWTSTQQLKDQASAVALSTLESVEGVMKAQQTLLTFRKVSGDVFGQTISMAADMSAALGIDLNSATMQLGKALEDPITGMTALTRSGTVFTQQQKDMVKAMVEAGDQAGAQQFILAELEAQYGGAGVAAAQGLAGSIDTLSQRWEEFQIKLMSGQGGMISSVIDGIADAIHWTTENMHIAKQMVIALMSAFHQFGVRSQGAINRLGEDMRFALTNPLDFARNKIADFFQWLNSLGAGAMRLLGLDGIADKITMNYDHIRSATGEQHKATLEQMKKDTEAEAAAVNQIYFEMFQEAAITRDQFVATVPGALAQVAMPTQQDDGVDPAMLEAMKYREQMANKFAAMAEGFYTELEMIAIQEEEKRFIVEEAFMNELITWEQQEEYKRMIEEEASNSRIALAEAEMRAKRNIMMSGMSNMASLMNTSSKKVFEIGKKAALANAAVSGGLAIMDAWKAGMATGGPWAPFIAAGYAVSAGVVAANNINNIRSQSYGGGGGTPTPMGQGSSGISAPVTAQQAPARPQQDLTIRREGGGMWTDDMVESLLEKVGDFSRDNDIALGNVRFA